MAEIVGVIAAGVEFTKIAIKAKSAWSDIKDAPIEVRNLFDEVCLLEHMLDHFNTLQNFSPTTMREPMVWDRCSRMLEASTKSIREITFKMKTLLESRKLTGRVRVYFKRHELTKCKDKLRDAQSLMIAVLTAISTQQNMAITATLEEVQTIVTETQKNLTTSVACAESQPLVTTISDIVQASSDHLTQVNMTDTVSAAPKVGSETNQLRWQPIEERTPPRNTCGQQRLSIHRVALPAWMFRKGLQILVNSGNSSWGVTLRSYNQISWDSDVFTYAWRGDWDAIRGLFHSGQASPYDTTEEGTTLLHVAVTMVNFEACKTLLDYGLSPFQEDGYKLSPLHCIGVQNYTVNRHKRALQEEIQTWAKEALSILTLFNASPSMSVADLDSLRMALGWIYPPTVVFIKMKEMMYPSYEDIDRLQRAMFAIVSNAMDPQLIFEILGTDQNLQQAFHLLEDHKCCFSNKDLIERAAFNLGRLYLNPQHNKFEFEGWLYVLSQSMQFESKRLLPFMASDMLRFSQGIRLGRPTSPFYRSAEGDNNCLTKGLRVWIGLLQACGVDLVEYGKAMKRKIDHAETIFVFVSGTRKRAVNAVRYFSYGSQVEDWRFFITPLDWELDSVSSEPVFGDDLYSVVGDFWHFTEDFEPFPIPGAYPKDVKEAQYQVMTRTRYCVSDWPMSWEDFT